MRKITAVLICISILLCPLTASAKSIGSNDLNEPAGLIQIFKDFADSVSAMIFGIPFTSDAFSNEFEGNISGSDIAETGPDTAFVKNMIMIAVDHDAGFFKKAAFFRDNKLSVIGWCCTIDMYIAACRCDTYKKAADLCSKLCKDEIVMDAFPVTADRVTENYTPDDPFDDETTTVVWNDSLPSGSNWWLECVEASSAWDYSEYFKPVKLGVIDSGFDDEHEDLIDTVTFPNKFRKRVNGPNDHGTHVAGIIAANADNGIGICGVCPDATLVCTNWKPAFAETWSLTFGLIFGVTSTVKAGAKAINLSCGLVNDEGKPSPGKAKLDAEARIASYVMGSLLHKGYDFIVVQSAGNGTKSSERIEAEGNGYFCAVNEENCYKGFKNVTAEDIIDRIIVVGCARNAGSCVFVQSNFSNVGEAVDICAPGQSVYSTITNSSYGYKSGTSMAAPVVTGICGLVWSVNPEFTGAEVKEIVCTSTNRVALANTDSAYLGDKPLTDKDMINAKLSVEKALLLTYGEEFFNKPEEEENGTDISVM